MFFEELCVSRTPSTIGIFIVLVLVYLVPMLVPSKSFDIIGGGIDPLYFPPETARAPPETLKGMLPPETLKGMLFPLSPETERAAFADAVLREAGRVVQQHRAEIHHHHRRAAVGAGRRKPAGRPRPTVGSLLQSTGQAEGTVDVFGFVRCGPFKFRLVQYAARLGFFIYRRLFVGGFHRRLFMFYWNFFEVNIIFVRSPYLQRPE